MAEDPLSLDFGSDKAFYVYLYRDPRPRKRKQPIYVGKGTVKHGRADDHWIKRRAKNPILRHVLAKISAAGLAPVIEIVGWHDDENAAFALEKALIARFGRRNIETGSLCNLTDGGEGPIGRVITEQTRAKLRASHLGQKISAENLESLRQANLGRKRSPEHTAKLLASRVGVKHTPEARAKISAAKRGKTLSAEHRAKIGKGLLGRPVSDKTMAALRRPRSPETKQRMKAAWVLRRLKQRPSDDC